MSDRIFKGLDEGLATVLILLDFSCAFDCVNHGLLCAKLHYFGLTEQPLSFFRNYLDNRKQIVRTSAGVSEAGSVTSGVPQGSILGPLLFLVYTFDLCNVAEFRQAHSYADDTQLIHTFDPTDYNDIVANVNADLRRVLEYSKKHNLKLNAKKTQVMLFAQANSKDFLKNYLSFEIDGQRLEFTDTAKNLGVVFDTRLRFSEHISYISKKSYLVLKALYANRHILNFKVKKKLCEAHIMSILAYCLILYYPCLTQLDCQRLQKIQNNCCGFVCGLRKYDHVSLKINQLQWLKMDGLFKYLILIFTYKLLKTSIPSYLRCRLVFRGDGHSVPVRANLLTVPRHSSSLFQRGFTYNVVSAFNKYFYYFNSTSIVTFRNLIRNTILEAQRSSV